MSRKPVLIHDGLVRAQSLAPLGWLARLPIVRSVAGFLFGRSASRPRSRAVRWLFLRSLGAVHYLAFASLGSQVLGLYGRRGILPIQERLERARYVLGPKRYQAMPSIFWVDASDATLVRACRAGKLLAALLVLGVAPRPVLSLLWALYLSFVSAGGTFLSFQWDALLLESSLHALLVAPRGLRPGFGREDPPWQAVLLLRWHVFRLYYESGLAKLQSGDVTWKNRTALGYHYETQPLPTPIGWYAHQLPRPVQRQSTRLALLCECIVPFLAFAPRRIRRLSFWPLAGLQAGIAATGNYGFFNLLTAVLGLWLLDDEPLLGKTLFRATGPARPMRGVRRFVIGAAATLLFTLTLGAHLERYGPRNPPGLLSRMLDALVPLHSVNTYGLFSVMTVRRPEIVIEGSDDGERWLAYEFRYKPTDPRRPPPWVAPHQPRLDWQMWFAALGPPPRWFVAFLARLLEGSPEVLALLQRCPFPDRPPRYVRAVLYEYRMTDIETRRRTGMWWERERLGLYFPAITIARPDAAAA
ncbi:lipase maturation factor family protein [Polyangium jinanense]|uniref:Lipase maturation factor 2 n=1 Tax=Polyangium jinanense TaxID=2829994 RepID=A0A9X3XDH8_9BACT|nr:lipase maturation factor family protein [Polyangium jinanense]MDC3960995.1 lipase maturation factor family protein [Polyangium jinanense]MDC3987415.1 lipase maturation factor family protein [Polyangium jinanense]